MLRIQKPGFPFYQATVCADVFSQVSLDFLPPQYVDRLQRSTASGRNFISMEVEQDDKAVDTMLRQSGQDKGSDDSTTRSSFAMSQLLDQLSSPSGRTARFVLMAAAGFGKTVFMKRLCVEINQRAVDNFFAGLPLALFVRAGPSF